MPLTGRHVGGLGLGGETGKRMPKSLLAALRALEGAHVDDLALGFELMSAAGFYGAVGGTQPSALKPASSQLEPGHGASLPVIRSRQVSRRGRCSRSSISTTT